MKRFDRQYLHNTRPGPADHGDGWLIKKRGKSVKRALTADRTSGTVRWGGELLASGVPDEMWRYELGGRPVMEHLLEGFRSRTRPYRQASLNERFPRPAVLSAAEIAELHEQLGRLAAVSVETMRIVDALAAQSPLHPANQPLAAPAVRPTPPLAARPEPPATRPISLPISPDQSEFWLTHYNQPSAGEALAALLDAHGHSWPADVEEFDIYTFWNGPKFQPGRRIVTMLLTPCL